VPPEAVSSVAVGIRKVWPSIQREIELSDGLLLESGNLNAAP
jgi:hypothetical protein